MVKKSIRFSKRYFFKLVTLAIIVFPYLIIIYNSGQHRQNDAADYVDDIKRLIDQISNLSPEQNLLEPKVLLKTLQFMIEDVTDDNPKLIEFVKSLIQPPSTIGLNLSIKDKSDFSQIRQTEKVDALLNHKENGFYIEAGAFDGEAFSNTLFFEIERKWNGLLIEPIPSIYKQLLKKNRHAFAINACIADKKPSIQKFNVLHVLSGRDSEMSNDHRNRINIEGLVNGTKINTIAYIPCFPLYTILKAIDVYNIDYFSLDVEGGELSIIQSIPYDKININVFTIESSANFFHRESILKHLNENSYKLISNDFNELYFCKNCNS